MAGLLRQLSEFYSKEAGHIFCIRLAKGLLRMGKGLIGLSPFYSDNMLLCGPTLGALLTLIHSGIDLKYSVLDKDSRSVSSFHTQNRPTLSQSHGNGIPANVNQVGDGPVGFAHVSTFPNQHGFTTRRSVEYSNSRRIVGGKLCLNWDHFFWRFCLRLH